MHLSTLGYTPNPLISEYSSAFLLKLQGLWKTHIHSDVPSDDFLLYPDIHSLLLSYASRYDSHDEEYRNLLIEELKKSRDCKGIQDWDNSQYILGTKIKITTKFYNPDIEKHSHPDHAAQKIGVTFWSKSQEEWVLLFSKSFDILRSVSPGFMGEIEWVIRKVIPFDVSYRVHNSGSYTNAIGHLVMSYPQMDNPEIALLEAILHEYNHNKLNLILQTELLILNDRREMFYSPYRPDPRPIHGIYLWVHALVWAYWVILNAHVLGILTLPHIWLEKAALYVFKNGLSLQVLDKYSRLSPLGSDILEEIRRVHQECLGFLKKTHLSREILSWIRGHMITHFQQVQAVSSELFY